MTFGPIERDDVQLPSQTRHPAVRAAAAAGEPFPLEELALEHAVDRWIAADQPATTRAALGYSVEAMLAAIDAYGATPRWRLLRRRTHRAAAYRWARRADRLAADLPDAEEATP